MRHRTFLLAGIAALALSSAPVFAAEAEADQPAPAVTVSAKPADNPDAEASVNAPIAPPNMIVVTATHRSESAQKVPIPISVLSGATLADTGTLNVAQVVQLQPSLAYYGTNPRNASINIRGLGAPLGLTNDGLEQGVGVYVDQVYYSRVANAVNDLYDVSRVEVLRGPQGTLYGKNTTAGAINIVTNQPTFSPEEHLELTVGSLDFLQAKAAISGPITDTLAFRVAGSGTTRRGTIWDTTTSEWLNNRESLSGRAILLWKPAKDLRFTLTGDYMTGFPHGGAQVYVRTGSTQRPLNRQFAALTAAQNYTVPSTNPFDRVTDLDTASLSGQRTGGLSLRAEWDLGGGTLTSVSAWRFWNWYPSNDRDFIGLPITTVSQNPSRHRQWTQELRYASKGGQTLDYVFGAFVFNQKFHTFGLQAQGPAASRFLLNPGAAVPPGASYCVPATANACNPAVLDGLTSSNDINYESTSAAAYGQLTWHVSDRFRIQPGIRVNYDKKDGSYVATVTTASGSTVLNSDQRNTLPPQSYQAHFDQWNLAYDLTASYDVARYVMAYATYAHGFKSAGINMNGLPLNNGVPVLSAVTVLPEKIDNFELGLKTQAFDRKATFNLAGFWTEIRDYQTTVTGNSTGVVLAYLANAPKVRVRGVEADLNVHLSDRLSFYANGAFTDAKYTYFPNAPCPPELSGGTTVTGGQVPSAPGTPGGLSPIACDISGQVLPGVSKWSGSYGFEYNHPATLAGRAGEVYFGFDGNSRSRFSSNPSPSAYTWVDGYRLANFRVGFRTEDRWNVFGWVKNAFDENYFEVLAQGPSNTGLIVGLPGDPRTWGVTFSADF